MQEQVVLVSPQDEVLGLMEKMQAHNNGLLHRAFSVFLFNSKGEMLLQRRSPQKYHSPELWTNACCSHPRIQETYEMAAKRRLREELGIFCYVEEEFHFIYKAKVGEQLWEHELDYVFSGIYDGTFELNPTEVSEVRYVDFSNLEKEISDQPQHFTEWFKILWDKYRQHLY